MPDLDPPAPAGKWESQWSLARLGLEPEEIKIKIKANIQWSDQKRREIFIRTPPQKIAKPSCAASGNTDFAICVSERFKALKIERTLLYAHAFRDATSTFSRSDACGSFV